MTIALPDPMPAATPHISRKRKAAIIVRLLLSEGAKLPLDVLPARLQADLTAEIGAMRYIDGATLRVVVTEFLQEMERIGLTFPGGIEGALTLLDGHISAEAAAGLRGNGTGAPDPWARIALMECEQLLPLVAVESTEVAAVLLSKLSTNKAAEILGALPGDQARRIACAVSLTGRVSPETVDRIGATLVEQFDNVPETAFEEPAATRIGAILNLSPSATRDDVLAGLEESDAEFAAHVKKSIFTFADLPLRLRPVDIPTVTRGVDNEVLVTALAGATATLPAVCDFILENMSRRMADQLREQVEERGTVREKDAEAAMTAVISSVRAAEADGEITLLVPDEQD
ncbi:flagellar motor switch protein FliG [Actibacterium lipolyticum]|uniref:Flagellar motor switch protein FliG n=1 Tax=Actibacterium lipolyticum TaxID=1524263 RepID=A0A238KJK7_9RHOB|nr:FliG C-terminal domain-containing protein [Actibacterium lipolyticum]SMX42216.1 Flagellar motor switch protein FliG [Actibacterium lipolyticum]